MALKHILCDMFRGHFACADPFLGHLLRINFMTI